MTKIYLYLASRSKKGIKLITILQGKGNSIVTSRVGNIKELELPQLWESQIQKIINDNKMLYEPWVESAFDYLELKQRLEGRGYKHLPMGPNPMLNIFVNPKEAPKIESSSFKIRRTMIRKIKK